jgi:alkylation response protein AidB-like acyl-CoA dehydrogenase
MPEWTPPSLRSRLRAMLSTGELALPFPAAGGTPARHRALYEVGRTDLSLARLVEAHTDAAAILNEAGLLPRERALYGVWASDGPGEPMTGHRNRRDGLVINGAKDFCSGAGIIDAALITVHVGNGIHMVDVPLNAEGISIDKPTWASPAFRATNTTRVHFRNVRVPAGSVVGGANWYLERVGFWHGAIGPAACWAGGAAGLVDAAHERRHRNPHTAAQLGGLEAARWALNAYLEQSGQMIDRAGSSYHEARQRALIARHLIERTCTEVMDRFGRATGPALLAFDAPIARRHAELALYIRQGHAERDLEAIVSEGA